MTDLYGKIAERYELFYTPQPEVKDFFQTLISQYQIQTVLDCSCGTGRELILLQSLGCQVVGSDFSDAMLDQARQNFAEANVDIPLHKADYRELPQHFTQHFDAALCWSAAIIHMLTDEEALKAFQSIYTVLNPGGILILDQGITDKRWHDKQRFSFSPARSSADVSRLYVIDYTGERDCTYHTLDIFHSNDRQELKVWTADTHILLQDDQERLLKEAGFTTITFYGSYDFFPYDKTSSLRLIAIAQK